MRMTVHNGRVPSLYVRVYRALFCPIALCPCSLTIREGVSKKRVFKASYCLFPHYTWGCIGECRWTDKRKRVPSLYVRVYRGGAARSRPAGRSLTIREGVSWFHYRLTPDGWFPHYTWGCIEVKKQLEVYKPVPSLYVRVYRCRDSMTTKPRSSLTIRESVSLCISWFGCLSYVPSLYVRVYRECNALRLRFPGSLITYESMLNSRYFIYRLFFVFHTKKYLIFQHIKYK